MPSASVLPPSASLLAVRPALIRGLGRRVVHVGGHAGSRPLQPLRVLVGGLGHGAKSTIATAAGCGTVMAHLATHLAQQVLLKLGAGGAHSTTTDSRS